MRSSRKAWWIFAFFFLLSMGGMAWVTHAVNSLEENDKRIRYKERLEEHVRLALWRMDIKVNSLINFVQWRDLRYS